MNPSIWGPDAWRFLHTIAFNYPTEPTQEEKDNHYYFFSYIADILPCPKCRSHYKNNLETYPIQLDSNRELNDWLIKVHNSVNISNGKPKWTYGQVYRKYKNLYNEESMPIHQNILKTCKRKYPIILLLIIILLILYILDNKKLLSFK